MFKRLTTALASEGRLRYFKAQKTSEGNRFHKPDSLSAKRDSHDISVKTSNTYSSQLAALQICKFLHVTRLVARAKPYNPPPLAGDGVLRMLL